jgi:hypothetical protein
MEGAFPMSETVGDLLRRTMAAHPELGANGFRYRGHDGGGDIDENEFAAAYEWLKRWPCLKRVGKRSPSSYHLKHVCERATIGYIANGALIAAAFALELPVKRPDWGGGPNAQIGIATRELNRDIVERDRRSQEAAMRVAYEARKRIP